MSFPVSFFRFFKYSLLLIFGAEAINIYETADGKYALYVGTPIETTTIEMEQELVQAVEAEGRTSITVAPYYDTQFTADNTEQLTKQAQRKFLNVATNLSKALGINITLIRDNLGGYEHNSGSQVRELSYTIEFDEVDAESAKLFASLLSDLGYQVQESVFSLTYLDANATDYVGTEYFIKCDTSDRHKVADALEKAGFKEYTITSEGVQILDFKKEEATQNTDDKQSLTSDNVDTTANESNFVDTIEALSKTLSGTITKQKFNSDYLGVKERQELYNNFLNQDTNGQAELHNQGNDGGTSKSNGELGNLGQQASQLRDFINEAAKNLQSFQQGQTGVDLTNSWQNGEGEYILNTPLTTTQLARSQLETEGDPMSSEEDQRIQRQQATFFEQIGSLQGTKLKYHIFSIIISN